MLLETALVVLLRRLAQKERFYRGRQLSDDSSVCPLHSSYANVGGVRQIAIPSIEQKGNGNDFLAPHIERYKDRETLFVTAWGIAPGRLTEMVKNAQDKCQILDAGSTPLTQPSVGQRVLCDVVLLGFNTLGCLGDEADDISLLQAAYDTVRPGGMLVIEQLNPLKKRQDRIEITVPDVAEGEQYGCVTYSSYIECDSYTKRCSFCFHTSEHYSAGAVVAKHDYHETRLYPLSWYEMHLPADGEPTTCKPYGALDGSDYVAQASDLLIIVGQKPYGKADRDEAKRWIADLEDEAYAREIDDASRIRTNTHMLDLILDKAYPSRYPDVVSIESGDFEKVVADIVQLGK